MPSPAPLASASSPRRLPPRDNRQGKCHGSDFSPPSRSRRANVFRQELRRLGYAEGQQIAIEYRSANGRFERLPDLAAELVSLKVEVIVAVVTQAALAAKRQTAMIPIVMVGVSDPVGSGLVMNLARPGGNVTGTSSEAADVVGKQLELLLDRSSPSEET